MTDNRATAQLSSVRLGSELTYAINTQERPIIIFIHTHRYTRPCLCSCVLATELRDSATTDKRPLDAVALVAALRYDCLPS